MPGRRGAQRADQDLHPVTVETTAGFRPLATNESMRWRATGWAGPAASR